MSLFTGQPLLTRLEESPESSLAFGSVVGLVHPSVLFHEIYVRPRKKGFHREQVV